MKNFIGGEWKSSSNNLEIEVRNPATNDLIDTIPNSTIDDVIDTVNIAKDSIDAWQKLSINDRCKIILKFLDTVKSNKEDLANLLSQESGKTYKESLSEFDYLLSDTSLIIECSKQMSLKNNLPKANKNANTFTLTTREPLGIVSTLLSYNMSINSFATKVISPLIMGNVVIVKPSKKTPLTISSLVYMLAYSGVVNGAIEVINGDGKVVGQALAMHPDINLISFVGSTANGIRVISEASKNMTKTLLDLSGNNSFILCSDGDVDLAVEETIKGRFYNAGQLNNSNKVFYVHTSIKKLYLDKLLKRIDELKIGIPNELDTDFGCLINNKRAEIALKQINNLVNEGAVIEIGGKRLEAYIEPTVLTNISPNMAITYNLDILGPVVPIIEYQDINSVIEVVNKSVYGKGISIFTKDLSIAFKLANLIEVGNVVINGSTNNAITLNDNEDWKYSGLGKKGIMSSLEECSQIKNITLYDVLK